MHPSTALRSHNHGSGRQRGHQRSKCDLGNEGDTEKYSGRGEARQDNLWPFTESALFER